MHSADIHWSNGSILSAWNYRGLWRKVMCGVSSDGTSWRYWHIRRRHWLIQTMELSIPASQLFPFMSIINLELMGLRHFDQIINSVRWRWLSHASMNSLGRSLYQYSSVSMGLHRSIMARTWLRKHWYSSKPWMNPSAHGSEPCWTYLEYSYVGTDSLLFTIFYYFVVDLTAYAPQYMALSQFSS